MKILSTPVATSSATTPVQPQLASRRSWLKGVSALLGTGLLAAPTALLAAPAEAPLPASALVGGDEHIGMVKLLAGTTVPQGWALCDGRLLPVAQHPALFAVLGNTYGGDGRTTFALPTLRISMGTAPVPAEAAETLPAAAAEPAPAFLPERICAIKVANAVATTTSLAELHLPHHRRPRASQVG